MTDMIHRVDFWFDPVCPYSWTASRWLEEVRELVPLEVNYHVMSLRISNEALDAGDTDRYDEVLRRSHEAGVGPVGGRTAGTPTIHLDGAAFFGPVLQSIPRGADAVRLLSGLQLLAASPSFYELKRDRTTMPVFG